MTQLPGWPPFFFPLMMTEDEAIQNDFTLANSSCSFDSKESFVHSEGWVQRSKCRRLASGLFAVLNTQPLSGLTAESLSTLCVHTWSQEQRHHQFSGRWQIFQTELLHRALNEFSKTGPVEAETRGFDPSNLKPDRPDQDALRTVSNPTKPNL